MTYSFQKEFAKNIVSFHFKTPEEHEYVRPSEVYEEYKPSTVHIIRAIYLNDKSRFGTSAVIVTDDFNMNAPSHFVEIAEQIRDTPAAVEAINEGKAGFRLYTYENKYGTQYGVALVDV